MTEPTTVTDAINETHVRAYEAMFLISQGVAADMKACVAMIQEILDRAGAEVIAMKKWDERRLAYEIDKQKRGVFFLVYFRGSTTGVASIERTCNLSDDVMRYMVLSAEHLTEEEMRAADARQELQVEAKLREENAAAKSESAEKAATEAAAESEQASSEG